MCCLKESSSNRNVKTLFFNKPEKVGRCHAGLQSGQRSPPRKGSGYCYCFLPDRWSNIDQRRPLDHLTAPWAQLVFADRFLLEHISAAARHHTLIATKFEQDSISSVIPLGKKTLFTTLMNAFNNHFYFLPRNSSFSKFQIYSFRRLNERKVIIVASSFSCCSHTVISLPAAIR